VFLRLAIAETLRVSRKSWLTYAGLVAILVLGKVVFLLIPTTFPGADQATAFTWPVIFGISALGAVGLAIAPHAGIPDAWDPRISNAQRFLLPLAEGVLYGVVTVLRDLGRPSDVHLSLPLSVPFYTFGAVFLEILLRVFALTTLTYLLWKVLLRGRWYGLAFWTANIVVALYEPIPFIEADLAHASHLAVPGILVDWAFQPLFLANVLTGYMYRRYGMLNAVVLRLAFYAIWHVAYGGFRPFWLAM
jgi:hypothetical protein